MKTLRFIIVVIALAMLPVISQAKTYTFTPSDNDLADLPHGNYFTWGIRWTLPSDEEITAAKITYHGIWDWQVESDHLYTHLLDTVNGNGWGTPVIGTGYTYYRKTITSNDSDGSGDSFPNNPASGNLLLGDWNDPNGGNVNKAIDLTYDIPSQYFGWLSSASTSSPSYNGNFGFGIDPNCHYYNSGVEVEITTRTKSVPEPATMLLLGLGLIGVGAVARRKIEK